MGMELPCSAGNSGLSLQPTRDVLSAESKRPRVANETPELDDKQPYVSAPAGRLLAAKSEHVRLPNT